MYLFVNYMPIAEVTGIITKAWCISAKHYNVLNSTEMGKLGSSGMNVLLILGLLTKARTLNEERIDSVECKELQYIWFI